MRWWLLLALLWGCQRTDPELASQRAALDQWQEGREALEEGEPELAERHFERALQHRPDDPVIQAWQAQAAARRGDTERAVALLDVVLARHPGFAEARYNRAAYLARLDDPEAAAADLKRALDDGAARPRDVLTDPDFQPWLDHPSFAFLPSQGLSVATEAPQGVIFLGSRADVRLRILGMDGGRVSVRPEEARGPVRLVSVVEDETLTSDGEGRDLTFTFQVVGEGEVVLGPLDVQANGHGARVEPITFNAAAPEGHETPEVPPLVLVTPSELGADLAVGSATWSAPTLLVKAERGDRVIVEPDPGPADLRMELRQQGRPEWILLQWRLQAPPDRIRILRAGQTILDGAPVKK